MFESGFRKNDILEIDTQKARNSILWKGVNLVTDMQKILDAIDRGAIENRFVVLRETPHISCNMEYFHMKSDTPRGIHDGCWTWNTICFSRKFSKLFTEDDIFRM